MADPHDRECAAVNAGKQVEIFFQHLITANVGASARVVRYFETKQFLHFEFELHCNVQMLFLSSPNIE